MWRRRVGARTRAPNRMSAGRRRRAFFTLDAKHDDAPDHRRASVKTPFFITATRVVVAILLVASFFFVIRMATSILNYAREFGLHSGYISPIARVAALYAVLLAAQGGAFVGLLRRMSYGRWLSILVLGYSFTRGAWAFFMGYEDIPASGPFPAVTFRVPQGSLGRVVSTATQVVILSFIGVLMAKLTLSKDARAFFTSNSPQRF